MKIVNVNNEISEKLQDVNSLSAPSIAEVNFDMSVYNELSDQPTQNIDVLSMLQKQIALAQEISARRSYLLKEVSAYFKK